MLPHICAGISCTCTSLPSFPFPLLAAQAVDEVKEDLTPVAFPPQMSTWVTEQGVGSGVGTTPEVLGGPPQLGGPQGGRGHSLPLRQEETRTPTGEVQLRTPMGSGAHHQVQVCVCVCACVCVCVVSACVCERGRELCLFGGIEIEEEALKSTVSVSTARMYVCLAAYVHGGESVTACWTAIVCSFS